MRARNKTSVDDRIPSDLLSYNVLTGRLPATLHGYFDRVWQRECRPYVVRLQVFGL
jgi:hypothetical protein